MPLRRRLATHPAPRFPSAFPSRLLHFKEAAGLSWRELARQMGTEPRTLRRWRRGQRPSPAYLMALFCLAQDVPDGQAILLGHHAP